MGKSTKTLRLREEMRAAVKQSKQTTFDNLPEAPKNELAVSKPKKQIIITEIKSVTKEDELELKVGFRLLPSKTAFSRLNAELYFDGEKLRTLLFRILPSPLSKDDSEFTFSLDMRGISAGSHFIKVEMCELWSSGEKLTCIQKEVPIEYILLRREDRLIKVPTVKSSVAGADLEVVSGSEREIYRDMEESVKREAVTKRDEW
jgi:hypothetical protein